MKRMSLVVFALICVLCFSCSKESLDTQIEQEPEMIDVSFLTGGEFDITIDPLTKTETNDLYAITVCQSDTEKTDIGDQTNAYAYGVFDDLSKVKVSLVKGKYYHFELIYVPNGKNMVYKHNNNTYGVPFQAAFDGRNAPVNEMEYNPGMGLTNTYYGATQGVGISSYMIQENLFNTIERYQGLLCNFKASPDNVIAKINLYRMMVGLKLIVNDFTKGKITLKSNYGHLYNLLPSTESTTNILDIVVETLHMPSLSFNFPEVWPTWNNSYINKEQPFPNEQIGTLIIVYTDENGDELIIYNNENFKFIRLSKHTLEFSLPQVIEGGIQPNIIDDIDDDMVETEWN